MTRHDDRPPGIHVPDAPQADGPDLDDQGLETCPRCDGDGIEPVDGAYPKHSASCGRCYGEGVVEKDG